jgi:hypothetical protein
MRSKPLDAAGNRLKIGDRVRVLGIPDLSRMRPKPRAECLPVFKHLLGQKKRISSFDELGNAELVCRILKGKLKGLHVVGIEPNLLRKISA